MAFLKRKRVKPGVDFEWSSKLWVHNVFRAFEMVFGRKIGIRAGTSIAVSGNQTIVYYHTIEDALAGLEVYVRNLFSFKFSHVQILQPAVAGMSPFGNPYLFAVVFDVASGVGSTAGSSTSKTWSHTCTGSGLTLVASFGKNGSTQSITNQTYNGVAMTEAQQDSNTTSALSLCYLVSPATGSNTVSGTTANVSEWANCSVSLTGTTATPSAPGSNKAHATSTSPSVSVTTTVANSWVVTGAWCTNATFGTTTTGTNQTSRNTVQDTDSGFSGAISTQTTTATGSYTSGWTISNALWIVAAVEIQPGPVSSPSSSISPSPSASESPSASASISPSPSSSASSSASSSSSASPSPSSSVSLSASSSVSLSPSSSPSLSPSSSQSPSSSVSLSPSSSASASASLSPSASTSLSPSASASSSPSATPSSSPSATDWDNINLSSSTWLNQSKSN